MVGSPKCSTCCSTGSGARLANVSPTSSNTGSRFACATPAAVTMFSAPGPIDDVAAITWRRSVARAYATAASAMPCSFWPRQVGSSSPASCSAVPSPSTLPCPKIAKTPANSGTGVPSSSSERCAVIQRTSA